MRVRVVLMVKIIFKIFDHIIALINILGTIIYYRRYKNIFL